MKLATVVKAYASAACCSAALLIPALGKGGVASPAGTCLKITAGEEFGAPYRCDFKRDDNLKSSVCMRAIDRSESFPKTFTMEFRASGTTMRCACEATGLFGAPKFNASMTFLCGANANHDAAVGPFAPLSSKVTKGYYIDGRARS